MPLPSEPPVRLDYEIAMGVRYGEREWKATVERLLAEHENGIDRILREYGVPLLDAHGRLKPRLGRSRLEPNGERRANQHRRRDALVRLGPQRSSSDQQRFSDHRARAVC